MNEVKKQEPFKAGDRVAQWGSYRVGTILDGWETSTIACILWDRPRLKRRFESESPYYNWRSIEFQSLLPNNYIDIATEYQETQNKYFVKRCETYPRRECPFCKNNDNVICIDRERMGHAGTPYIYVYGCPACQKAYAVQEDGTYYG